MGFSLIPKAYFDRVQDIRASALTGRGITLLLADLDNTLAPYGAADPQPELLEWRRELAAAGVELFLLSNSRRPGRAQDFARKLGAACIGHAGKPSRRGFLQAMAQTGRRPDQTAVVGDQIFTDTLGGNLAGVTTLLVRPIRLAGNPGRYARYALETPFRMAARRRSLVPPVSGGKERR